MRIVMGVTIPESLKFLGPLPQMLDNVGWDVHLVSHPGPLPPAIAAENLKFHGIPMVRKPSITRDLHSLLLWFSLLRRLKPGIVSIGTPKSSLLGLFAAWALRVPRRVYVLRGLRLETNRGLSRWLLWLLESLTVACSTHVLSVSHSLAEKYIKLGLGSASKIAVLGSGSSHGVDIERFRPRPPEHVDAKRKQLGLAPGVPTLGFVGRFSKDKGAEALLATRKLLFESRIDHEILLLGSVENSRKTLDALNAHGRLVKDVGEVSNVEDYYPLMTVLLLPTKREGFPNVVLEAGATEVPTVSRSVTGAVDSIIDDETGILVESGSDQAFAEAVKHFLRDHRNASEFGKAARKRIRQEFDEVQVCKRLMAYYMNLQF
jgi:glycosyltransferase involved in cell wall biosynthesis